MRRYAILAAGAALLLASCSKEQAIMSAGSTAAAVADATGAKYETPLQKTKLDQEAVRTAYEAFDLTLDLIDTAMAVRGIRPGSREAIAVADGIRMVKKWLPVAAAAQRAGDAKSYSEAFAHIKSGFTLLKRATGEKP